MPRRERATPSPDQRELPTGTITFLFTDIEGSTRLFRALGDGYRQVQADHFALMRSAIDVGEGVEVKTEGDAFFVAFRAGGQAVRCAVDAQRRFTVHQWPASRQLRVRMGIHTGEAAVIDGDYLGIDVNLAARIAAAAHGGQILTSAATHGLAAAGLPEGIALRPLGEHRLKDFPRPIGLFQVTADDLPQEFPPPRTLTAGGALPKPRTSFVGRSAEVASVRRLLTRGNRLVTLTGPGGTGKTRLALQVAAKRPASAGQPYFVDLSTFADATLVPGAIAMALAVRETPDRPILESLTDELAQRRLLLVLDNLEQISGIAAIVRQLIDAGDGVTVLATSRTRLRLGGEQEFRVPPLAAPRGGAARDTEEVARSDGVALFVDRVRAANTAFRLTAQNTAVVADLVRRLDGLPLAIELAASRMRIMSLDMVLARLDSRLSLLVGDTVDVPERQRTIRGAIAWSYDLLEDPVKQLMGRLAVFRGGFTLDAAHRLSAGDFQADVETAIGSLVDSSLVQVEALPDDEVRFSMLEIVREYATEQLAGSGQELEARQRHADHVLELCLEGQPHLVDDQQTRWLDRFEREHDNIRAAVAWLEETRRAPTALKIAAAIWRFWQQRGHLAEGRAVLERLLAMPEAQDQPMIKARALIALGGIAWWQVDQTRAASAYDEATAIGRELDDPGLLGRALVDSSFVPLMRDSDPATTLQRLEEGLAAAKLAGDRQLEFDATADLAFLHLFQGDPAGGVAPLREAISLAKESGNPWVAEEFMSALGSLEQLSGDSEQAARDYRESLSYFIAANNLTSALSPFRGLAWVATSQGQHERAALLVGAEDRIREMVGGGPPLIDRFADVAKMVEAALGPERAYELRLRGRAMETGAALLYALREPEEGGPDA